MTTIVDKLNGTSSTPAPTATKGSGMTLGQEDFLKLMTTQLQTQDPFNPVDNTQMVAQMAQFSSVAGIAEMNQSLSKIAEMFNPNRLTDAAGWIGRAMLVESNIGTPLSDGTFAGEVSLPKKADQLQVSFVDASGSVLHTETLGAQDAGTVQFAWDGKDADGKTVANGPVKVVVNAKSEGKTLETGIATWTQIGGIQSPASGGPTQLVTGLGLLSPEEAIRLS